MQKGIRPGTERRCKMLRILLDKGMSPNMIGKYTCRMRGKSEEEKEQIAEQIIQELTNNTNSEPTP